MSEESFPLAPRPPQGGGAPRKRGRGAGKGGSGTSGGPGDSRGEGEDFPLVPAPSRGGPDSLPLAEVRKLGEDYDRARAFHESADADATLRGYAADWRRFCGYCQEKGVQALPAHPEVIAAYLSWLAAAAPNKSRGRVGYKPATLDRARAAIAAEHRKAGLLSPCSDPRVKRVMRAIRKSVGSRQRRAWPLMPHHLRAIFRWLDTKTNRARAVRDKAILAAGFAGGLRRSELVALKREDVRITAGAVVFFIERSKTDQEGRGAHVTFEKAEDMADCCPLERLREWETALGRVQSSSFYFRRWKKGEISREPIYGKQVERLVRSSVKAIGLDPEKYSAHSLRAGVATYLIYLRGFNPFEVKKHLRHKSTAMLEVYVRDWEEVPEKPPEPTRDEEKAGEEVEW